MHTLYRGICLGLLCVTAPAFADTGSVRVRVPYNIATGFSITTASSESMKYVTVQNVLLINPSRLFAQSYAPHDFHLLVDEKVYYPSVRPGLDALDLSEPNILGPNQSVRTDVSFLVPNGVTEAKFEFTPHWQSDAGYSVDFCCLYY